MHTALTLAQQASVSVQCTRTTTSLVAVVTDRVKVHRAPSLACLASSL